MQKLLITLFLLLPSGLSNADFRDATPGDNVEISVIQSSLLGSEIASMYGGIVAQGWFGTGFELAAVGFDSALKNTPPLFEVPSDFERRPNLAVPGNEGYQCRFEFARPIKADQTSKGLEEGFGAIFAVPHNPLDDSFGDLPRPAVYHPQADVSVRALNQYLNSGLDKPQFPSGHHIIQWEAETQLNYILDVGVPLSFIPIGAASEYFFAKKIAAKKPQQVFKYSLAAASEAGLISIDITNALEAEEWYQNTTVGTASNRGSQQLTVWDIHAPYFVAPEVGDRIDSQGLTLEATDFGGVRLDRVAEELQSRFLHKDDCNEVLNLTLVQDRSTILPTGETTAITWKLVDDGPFPNNFSLDFDNQNQEGETVIATLTQFVTVEDTQGPLLLPPSGFSMLSMEAVELSMAGLGRPRVVDLADATSTYAVEGPQDLFDSENNTWTLEPGHRYLFDWSAKDASDNLSEAPEDNPDAFRQVVSIKTENTAPTAVVTSADTLTATPVEIQLYGIDTDLLDGRVDPLTFEIDTHPDNGQFEAPLMPYWIEDFRISPAGEQEIQNIRARGEYTTAKASPLGDVLAQQFYDSNFNEDFLFDQVCLNGAAGGLIPQEFIYKPTYVYADDDRNIYIGDTYLECFIYHSGNIDAEYFVHRPRISKWSPEGDFLKDIWLPEGSQLGGVNVDVEGNIWVKRQSTTAIEEGYTKYNIVRVDSELTAVDVVGRFTYGPESTGRFKGFSIDTKNQLIYELHTKGIRIQSYQSDLTYDDIEGVGDCSYYHCINLDGMNVDNNGYLYVTEPLPQGNRFFKYNPAVQQEDGTWQPGSLIGWMGRCTGNKVEQGGNGVQYNACDVETETSKGFLCTDDKCQWEVGSSAGSGPGQFNNPTWFRFDPNNFLYVTDKGNARIQRFSDDGVFSGQARSTGSGINQGDTPDFILGNFGIPGNTAVNSDTLLVLSENADPADNFVHVFKSLPFFDVTDSSAKVIYTSDFNFHFDTDSFTYTVHDGIDKSEPASVNVYVSRAYNPPENLRFECFADENQDIVIPCELNEDSSIIVRLVSEDLDGFFSTDGLDSHVFSIVNGVSNGELTLLTIQDDSATYRYSPNPNYFGEDEFSFVVDGGHSDISDSQLAGLVVNPVYDPYELDLESEIVVPQGFPHPFFVEFNNVDQALSESFVLNSIDWGDNTDPAELNESTNLWENHGSFDSEGKSLTAFKEFGSGNGVITVMHTYTEVSVSEPLSYDYLGGAPGAPADSVRSADIIVKPVIMLTANASPQVSLIQPEQSFGLNIDLENVLPEGWAGITASSVQFSIHEIEQLNWEVLDSRCTIDNENHQINCAHPADILPDASTSFEFTVSMPVIVAREQGASIISIALQHDGPVLNENTAAMKQPMVIEAADFDGDGVIDFDDAFVRDPRYQLDTDGDGMADRWERLYGLDVNNADDALSDPDGDGLTNGAEFLASTSPLLINDAEIVSIAQNFGSDQGSQGDRFGYQVASGDLNGDGFTDVVVGAPGTESIDGQTVEGKGAVFVFYGSVEGLDTVPDVLGSYGPQTFGRTVAVNDFDGDGYFDIAVGVEADFGEVALYFGDSAGISFSDLAVPDFVLRAVSESAPSENFGASIFSDDLDNDGLADLLIGAPGYSGDIGQDQGAVYVYLAKDEFIKNRSDIVSVLLEGPEVGSSIGDSISVGDIDGDNDIDLVVGAGLRAGAGQASIYLGKNIQWSSGEPILPSKIITGLSSGDRFAYSLSTSGDIDGDNIDDLVIGAYAENASRGVIHWFSSASQYWLQTNPVADQVLAGDDDGDQLGIRVTIIGDINLDGYDDVIAGANRSEDLHTDQGEVRLLLGSAVGLQEIGKDLGVADDMLGYSLVSAGDVNGDNQLDYVAGAPNIATTAPGQVYLFLGGANILEVDSDVDLVGDDRDNCITIANSDQSNIDNDDLGDLCDEDMDNDTVLNTDDNCAAISNVNQLNNDRDQEGDACDSDDDNDGVNDDIDTFVFDERYSKDSDGDGMADSYENLYGLNPNENDADLDSDGDGLSNSDEFSQTSNPVLDDIPPSLIAPDDIVASSTGPLTMVELGSAVAEDTNDGNISAAVDNPGPYAPGRYLLEWSAADASGNTVTAIQQLDVIPQANFVGVEHYVDEGNIVRAKVQLNGNPVAWPVLVPFTLSGSADNGSDYRILESSFIFEEPQVGDIFDREATVELEIYDDGFSETLETIVFNMDESTNSVIGIANVQTWNIVEENLAPKVQLQIKQDGLLRSSVVASTNVVRMQVSIDDPNSNDVHTIDWSNSDSQLVALEGVPIETFTFLPSDLAEGVYPIEVLVMDNGVPTKMTTVKRWVKVVADEPVLSFVDDTDNDGISDGEEGLLDLNQNGVDDYLEPVLPASILVSNTEMGTMMQTDNGLVLRMGAAAAFSGADPQVTEVDVRDFGSGGGVALNAEDVEFDFPLGIFDFEVSGLPMAGGTANIVLPLEGAILPHTTYRKYLADIGWNYFIEDDNNRISSTAADLGACPAPGSDLYHTGLTDGDYCIQLTIEDGGPNDADGLANGIIVDPSGASVVSVDADVTFTALGTPDSTVENGSSNVVVLRFRLESNVVFVELSELSLTALGTGDDVADIRNVTLWVDVNGDGVVDASDTEIGSGTYQTNDGTMTLLTSVPYPLPMGNTDFIVSYSF